MALYAAMCLCVSARARVYVCVNAQSDSRVVAGQRHGDLQA